MASTLFGSIELPPYGPASEIVPMPGTLAGVTSGGTVTGEDVGPDITMWHLDYTGLTLAQIVSLRAFFLSTIRAAYNTFIFTDKDEITTYTMRWWNAWELKPDVATDWSSWSGLIVLKQEIET